MLRVIQTKSAVGAKSYYSRSDYLSEGQELVGRWGGKGAQLLGLSGEVDKESFDRLCDNLDPRSGQRLTLRTKGNRSVGYDFNFHAPKGVSMAYLVNGDQRILQAFQLSVDETMREIEDDVLTRVRKNGAMAERVTGNLVYGGFDHFTTREVDGEADPHLHGHRLVFNATWDGGERAWKAIQFRELKRDAGYYEAAFHARLAGRMKDLGYGIERKGRDWDIAGLDKATKDKFSRRTKQIEALAETLGIEDAKQKDELGAKSRVKKTYGTSLEELRAAWQRRLDANESASVAGVTKLAMSLDSAEPRAMRDAEAIGYARSHCFERDSVVPKRKVLTEALRHGLGDVDVGEVHRQYASQRIITRSMQGREWSTLPEILVEEKAMLDWARNGRGKAGSLNGEWSIKSDWLNADQKAAIQHVLCSPDKVLMIRGGAGTGKTALMREAVAGIEAGGHQVFTFAPSAQASRGVLASEGFKATTVSEMLVNEKMQSELRGQVVWIDEAGLLGTRTLKQVMDVAERVDARLILSGDWRQHGSVERGAAMRLLEQQGGITPAVVRKIQRQDGAYREAVAVLAEGRTDEGLDRLNDLGWVHEVEDMEQRLDLMATRYANGIDAGETVLAVAPTHAEAELLHNRIRTELMRREVVGKDEREFVQLNPLHLTEAEKTDQTRVAEGDVMVFHRKLKDVDKDERIEATEANAARFRKSAKAFEVFRKRSIKLARGDLVRITRNGKTKDGAHALHNGDTYRIKEFSKRGDLVLENGWVVDRDYGFLGSGYVSTSHASQGKTVDRVLIAESSMSYPAAGREQFYVSVSRGRKQAEVFTDDKQGLADAIGKTDGRLSATELLDGQTIERVQRVRRQQREAERLPERVQEKEHEYERA